MTTFAQLVDLTVEQTRKPELVDITNIAVRTAIIRAHHFDFFPFDLREQTLAYTPSSTAWQYNLPNLTTLLPQYRAIKGMRGLEVITGVPIEEFEYRELDDMYTSDGERRSSVYTLVGNTLRIVPAAASGSLSVYYYANPNTAGDPDFGSWIADMYPDQVAMLAATAVWNRTGFREMAQSVEQGQNAEFKAMLISSYLLGEVN